jgi:hypothetical protein
MDIIQLKKSIAESPLQAAMDTIYDFVKTLAPPGANDRLALFGAVTYYDINPKAKLYNDYIVRAFADRTVQTSPISSMNAGDFADRYSEQYCFLLKALASQLEEHLSGKDKQIIKEKQDIINKESKERDTWLNTFNEEWMRYAKEIGIDFTKIATDPEARKRYEIEKIAYFKHRNFARNLKQFNDTIEDAQDAIDLVKMEAFQDDEAQLIMKLYKASREYQTIRPRDPDLEINYNWNAYTIQDPIFADMQDIFDIGQIINSIPRPEVALNVAGQTCDITTSSKITNEHDHSWNASAGASYLDFIKGDFATDNASNFKNSLENIVSASISFKSFGILSISRTGWFSSTLFEGQRVQNYLKNKKMLAKKLALLTTELVVGRGLQLKLTFKNSEDARVWGSTKHAGSEGINILGFQIGGKEGSSEAWDRKQINEAEKTVTFNDDESVCRLLGEIVTPVHSMLSLEEIALPERSIMELPNLESLVTKAVQQRQLIDASLLESVFQTQSPVSVSSKQDWKYLSRAGIDGRTQAAEKAKVKT